MNTYFSNIEIDMIQAIFGKIAKSQRIALFTHKNPDSDAFGSLRAIEIILRNMGKQTESFFFVKNPKRMPNSIRGTHFYKNMTKINLAPFDLAFCLDTVFSQKGILGINYIGMPTHGIIIIDHHKRKPIVNHNIIDLNLISVSSTSEIIYMIVKQNSKRVQNPPKHFFDLILEGMLDDMVGLQVPSKITPTNSKILDDLKSQVGESRFDTLLRKINTLTFPRDFESYTKNLKHYKISGKYHCYLLEIPKKLSRDFSPFYTNLLKLFEHYARVNIHKQDWTYGFFLMTIEEFQLGKSKISARGPEIKRLLLPVIDNLPEVLGYGISGGTALGGTAESTPHLGKKIMEKVKKL